jgi:hypothetical protein
MRKEERLDPRCTLEVTSEGFAEESAEVEGRQ